MRCSFVFQSVLVVAAPSFLPFGGRDGPLFLCHALVPPSSDIAKPSSTSSLKLSNGRSSRTALRESASNDQDLTFGDDAWDDDASEAILGGQGNFFFGLGSVRGGDDEDGKLWFSALSPNDALRSMKEGYRQRIAADPSFLSKSLLEIVLAASTQYMAEVSRRGKDRMLAEIDFVFAGVLTAVCGKYYSMWRVARTANAASENDDANNSNTESGTTSTSWRDRVPTNAFQPYLLDGTTKPSLPSRLMAFLLPMPQLFRAGVIVATIGYGLTSFLIQARTRLVPEYVMTTKPVSVPLAAIYTGLFMAFVSNIRYQILQGVVEPYVIDGFFFRIEALGSSKTPLKRVFGKLRYLRHLKKLVVVLVRWANGLLGSWIAIGGMRAFGLQQLKD